MNIEDLKCCGNCKCWNMRNAFCKIYKIKTVCFAVCDNDWEYDDLLPQSRIKYFEYSKNKIPGHIEIYFGNQ